MKIPAMSVRFVVGATFDPKTSALMSAASSGVTAYLRNRRASTSGERAAVQVLVLDRHQALVEQRIALARDLDEVAEHRVVGVDRES